MNEQPKAERQQLQQLVADLIEGVILMDPRGHITWANTAALTMHGCEKLEQLGVTAAQYRKHFVLTYLNRHKLQAAQYPIDRALAGDAFSDVKVEVTLRDVDSSFRCILMLRSVHLCDTRGELKTIALVIKDETERVEAEERFERAFSVNPAPAVICRLADNQFIKVNHGFLKMTGYSSEDVLGQALYQFDVLRHSPHRDDAIAKFCQWQTIPQQEATLLTQAGAEKYVIVAGQPIEMAGDACMMFTFIDLDERKQVEDSLRDSEERFSKAFDLAPVPMMVCAGPSWQILEVNAAFEAITGHEAKSLRERTVAEAGLWKDATMLTSLRDTVRKDGGVRNYEAPMRSAAGLTMDMLISAEPVTIARQDCVLCVLEDITERKRTEVELVAAIDAVMQDTTWFSRTVMEKLAQLRHPGAAERRSELADLTDREREILGLMCRGRSNAQIATELQLAANTVRNHIASIYDKIGVHDRSAAVIWGRERGLVGY